MPSIKSIEFAGFLYIIFSGLFFHVFAFPEIIKAFFALPSLGLIPYLFGKGLFFILNRFFSVREELNVVSRFLYFWFVGFFSLFVTGYVLLLKTFNMPLYLTVIFIVCGLGTIPKNKVSLKKELQFLSGDYRLFLITIALGLVPILITKYYTEFPLVVHTDWMSIPIDYKSIIQTTQYGIITPFGVDHLCSRNLLNAVISLIFNIDPLSLLWCLPFILPPIVAASSFLFSYLISKKTEIALIAGIVSSLLLSGTQSTDFPIKYNAGSIVFALFPLLIYLAYSFFKDRFENKNITGIQSLWGTLATITIIWLVLKYLEMNNTNWKSDSPLLITCQLIFTTSFVILFLARYIPILKNYLNPYFLAGGLTLLVIHTFYAIYYVFIISCFLSIHWLLMKKQKLKIILFLFVAFTFFYIFLQLIGLFYVPNINLISSHLFSTLPPYDLFVKFEWLTNAIGVINIIFISIGGLFLLLGKNEDISVISILSLILFFYFSPEAWSYRFLNASVPFIAYAIAHTISKIKLNLKR